MTLKSARKTAGHYIAHYLYGLFANSFNGGISAMDAVIGLAVGSTMVDDIHAINWKGAAAVFLVTCARSAIRYFKDNPIPEKFEFPEDPSEQPENPAS